MFCEVTIPITNEDHPPQTEPFLDVFNHALHRGAVALVSLKEMMSYRPSVDHHHPHKHLAVSGFAIPTMAVLGQFAGTPTLEIGGGQIIKNQIHFERKEIAQAKK